MSAEISPKTSPFLVRDCVLTTMATGYAAHTLVEFRNLLKNISAESIYHHFWRPTIETSLAPGSFYNDFSHWAHYELHDDFLAERLTWIDPTEYRDLEQLRADMLEILEIRIDEKGSAAFSVEATPFYFVTSKIVIFNTTYKMEHPKDLVKILPEISRSSIFYHFVDARRRQFPPLDDFSTWLQGYEQQYVPLIQHLKEIDPYFISLTDLQHKLSTTVIDYFLKEPHHE